MTDKYYVVGDWQSGKEKCPLNKAGLDEQQYANELAEEFDDYARGEYDLESGVTLITEDEASEVWNNLVQFLEGRLVNSREDELNEMHTAMFQLAEKVQRELNWV